eukprot:CAMPEP_0204050434 /NCGR_PEP_ID=MMETSP0360-20130528/120341_1 /ASSEMBLY_ACC=CAM_ASM_000342 /TAXON_ID=268821 /ORGANISM="Scrippsiella Hangoei, Strain SHTV-5" /LENGTH=63 /DNA_ID=CAMNT_0050997409 /DNA_START=71 /DNA_END=259 /DNA_ORIENTATION=+
MRRPAEAAHGHCNDAGNERKADKVEDQHRRNRGKGPQVRRHCSHENAHRDRQERASTEEPQAN